MAILKRLSVYPMSVPSGKRLHNYGKIHHAINGKIHYFYGHLLSIKLLVITRPGISS